jgi:hypothetical protein
MQKICSNYAAQLLRMADASKLTLFPSYFSAFIKSPAFDLTPASGSKSKRFVMNFKIEVVSYGVESIYPRLTEGPISKVGMRVPGPHRSSHPAPAGGAT